MSEQARGYGYLTLAMVLVGSTVVASKIIAAGLPTFTALALRFAVAVPIFLVLIRLTGTQWPVLGRKDWAILTLQAAAGSVGYAALLISGLHLTSATDAGVITGILPITSAAMAVLVLGERPGLSLLGAIALATAGVLAITFRAGQQAHSLAGNALVVAAVACESVFILLNKRLRVVISPLILSTLMSILGLALSIVPALLEMPWRAACAPPAVGAAIYYALVPTVGGFLLWYAGAAKVSGAQASLFTAVAPVAAVLLAGVFLGESIGVAQIVGIGCVLGAMLIAVSGQRATGAQSTP